MIAHTIFKIIGKTDILNMESSCQEDLYQFTNSSHLASAHEKLKNITSVGINFSRFLFLKKIFL